MSYTAMTIGPIEKTLNQAKKTREIWGASYFFSYIMKSVAKKLNEKDVEFVTPYVSDEVFDIKEGVGLFHDRLIFKSDKVKKDELEKIVDEVLKEIEEFTKNGKYTITKDFLKNYLQIHILTFEKEFENPILDISSYLDTAELFTQTQKGSNNQILDFIKNRLVGSFLAKDAFGKNNIGFSSLPKIALNSIEKKLKEKSKYVFGLPKIALSSIEKKLKEKSKYVFGLPKIALSSIDENPIKDEQKLMAKLIDKHKDKLKPYNKYICIVQADGDRMGKALEKIGKDKEELKKFSKTLFEFCKSATKMVTDFKGQMIYAGGDDLLFFAPVVKGNKTIFELCKELSKDFENKMKDFESKPTLSFGISITYFKYPLYEARKNAASLLFEKAKSKDKNAIAYQVIKHSGQTFEGVISKSDNELFEKFLNITTFNENFDSNFLHSIYTKIDRFKIVLNEIAKKDNNKEDNNKKKRLKNFFDNNFNEKEHKNYREFFEELIDFMSYVYDSDFVKDKQQFIHSALRFKKFLLGDKR